MKIICDIYFSKLKERKSSHLEGNNARSAGQGFNFLEGYEELLIQIPDANPSSLMLKAEGHTAKPLAHLLGYIKKVKTGTGETANPNLNNLALQHSRFGSAAPDRAGARPHQSQRPRLIKSQTQGFFAEMLSTRKTAMEAMSATDQQSKQAEASQPTCLNQLAT